REGLAGLARGEASGSCEVLDEGAARAFWARHDELRTAATLRARVAALPSHIEPLAAGVLPALAAACASPGFLWYATLGLGFFCGEPRDASSAATAVLAARGKLGELGGTLTLTAAPRAVRERADVWGPPPAALALMQSVKARLDPERRLAPGRFVGGL
ncbi:MAG TPA: hypothetical protein VGS00_11025, partial [Thermoanaerobaculia bacterium]|nr:hypothetical protein [Thermoanaerobaculia bacterium]